MKCFKLLPFHTHASVSVGASDTGNDMRTGNDLHAACHVTDESERERQKRLERESARAIVQESGREKDRAREKEGEREIIYKFRNKYLVKNAVGAFALEAQTKERLRHALPSLTDRRAPGRVYSHGPLFSSHGPLFSLPP